MIVTEEEDSDSIHKILECGARFIKIGFYNYNEVDWLKAFIYFDNPRSFKATQKYFNNACVAYLTDHCMKENLKEFDSMIQKHVFEFGDKPHQGKKLNNN